ncbi:unnamed protein product [Pseudo-nitzschia multistriata]|uniref:Uncharacterized protein n=1 Tax=Pseudo-nitzschia multistriata TaxID=183589 RepID=A0A448ZHC0_9STRA|nr:unnamed protein product [Pseudo-nitzschia multistriata]
MVDSGNQDSPVMAKTERKRRKITVVQKAVFAAATVTTMVTAGRLCSSSSSAWSSLFQRYSRNNSMDSAHGQTHTYLQTNERRRRLGEIEANMENDDFVAESQKKHHPMFSVSDTFTILGPTVFPKPTYVYGDDVPSDKDLVTYLQPTSGSHRPDRDSVFVFAAEYKFDTYVLFLMSLYDTGFRGDVVFGISKMDWENKEVRKFLEHWQNAAGKDEMTVVVYVVPYHCYNLEGEVVPSHRGGMRVCKCNDMFGLRAKGGDPDAPTIPIADKRHGRTAQTIRYELYWIWSEHYDPDSWILLIDARDTIFQQTPFGRVPRRENHGDDGGVLIFFGENADATSLGQSKYNRKWLTLAYGESVADAFYDKPTICSGSTMGEQKAIETYLRAEVAESDESKTVIFGADQGFHNYLYYSNKMANAEAISQILVQDQGLGLVNNMGALRDKPLSEWGNGRMLQEEASEAHPQNTVFNWDGTVSPIVHQYDRHKVLSKWWCKTKYKEYKNRWNEMKK